MRRVKLAFALLVLLALFAAQAQAGLVITPTFDSSWSADGANATGDENAIRNIISTTYEADFTNPINVSIDFSDVTTGLGESYTSYYYNDYTTYRSALTTDKQTRNGGDGNTAFLSQLPASGNPVPGNSRSGVIFTSAQGRALGFNTPGGITVGTGTFDSQISLNVGLTQSGGYSLTGVASHEIDEVLGLGSALDGRGDLTGTPILSNVGSLDFFRYSAAGTRSFTSSSSATSYFSDNGGATVISYFNQVTGADYHDWKSDPLPNGFLPQVQDAFSTPNSTTNLQIGPSEFKALNDVGYNRSVTAAPEPSQFAALGFAAFGAFGLILKARRKRRVPS